MTTAKNTYILTENQIKYFKKRENSRELIELYVKSSSQKEQKMYADMLTSMSFFRGFDEER